MCSGRASQRFALGATRSSRSIHPNDDRYAVVSKRSMLVLPVLPVLPALPAQPAQNRNGGDVMMNDGGGDG
jgi:hypothetical protein